MIWSCGTAGLDELLVGWLQVLLEGFMTVCVPRFLRCGEDAE
jgi:hypothetical protein